MIKVHTFAISCSLSFILIQGETLGISSISPSLQWARRSVKLGNQEDIRKDDECDKKRLGK